MLDMIDKTLNEMNEQERICAAQGIIEYKKELISASFASAERASKALFITNGGGLGAVFISALQNNHIYSWAVLCYFLGLITAFLLVGIEYLMFQFTINSFHERVHKYFLSKLKFNEIFEQRTFINIFLKCLGIISFLAFISGSIIVMLGMNMLSGVKL